MTRQLFNAMVAQYGDENINNQDVVTWSSGVPCNVPSLKFYGKCEQSTTPTPDSPVDVKYTSGTYRHYSTRDSFDIAVPDLYGIGEYKDEWDYVTGKGLRRVHKVVLDGVSDYSRMFTTFSVQSDGVILCGLSLQYKTPTTGGGVFRSSHFRGSWQISYGCMYTTNQTGAFMFFEPNRFPDQASSNAWLAEQYANGNPVTVYYAMAEPIPFEERPEPYRPILNENGRVEPKNVSVTGVDLKLKCINHSTLAGDKKINTVNGTSSIEWSGGAHCYLPSVKFYGNTAQDGTPTPDNPLPLKSFSGFYQTANSTSIVVPTINGIGEYKDEWDYVTGKGVRRIGERVLKGTEYWLKYHWGNGQGYYSYRMQIKSFNISGKKCMCTHYAPISGYSNLYYGRVEGAYAGTTADNDSWLVIGNSFPTVDEFKAFLAEQYANGTPVTVYYAIAEPIPFEERPTAYVPIPNDSGKITFGDGTISDVPFEVSYITHS